MIMIQVKSENVINFGLDMWTYGKCVYVDGKKMIITKNEDINIGEEYVMQIGRNDFALMNPCLDADEQNRCNVPSPISKSCYKILVHSHQIEKNIYDKLVLNSWVLVKCYPDMDGAGQSGWLVNNDVEGHSNIVKLFLPNK